MGRFTNPTFIEVNTMDAATVTAITGAVDYASIITGIGAVAAAIVGVLVAVKGAKMLLSMVRGG